MAYPLHRRHHGFRTIIVPPTTDMALVFPFDHESKKFDKGFYSSFLTDGRVSSDQIEVFLKDVEDTFKEKFKWVRRLKAYLIFSFVTGIFLMTFYTLTILSGVNDDSYNAYNNQQSTPYHNHNGHNRNFKHHNRREYSYEEQMDMMFMAWFFLFFAALVWAIIFRCVKRCSFRSARKSIQGVVDRHAPFFANSGLRWNLPLAFPHYIELWKDYRGQNYVQPVPQFNNTQPVNHMAYNANPNPLSFNQIYNQLQNQDQNQKYPTLNQVAPDQFTCLDFQNRGITNPLLNNQPQRREGNTYVPPYPIHYVHNA